MMGRVIYTLLFVLVMEMILCSTEVNTNEITNLSMKAFMEDVTLVTKSRKYMKQLVTRLQELFKRAAMKIKPSKCRSLSIIKGNCREIKISFDGNKIPTIHEKNPLRALVTAIPYHLLIDIVGRTEANCRKMDHASLINVSS